MVLVNAKSHDERNLARRARAIGTAAALALLALAACAPGGGGGASIQTGSIAVTVIWPPETQRDGLGGEFRPMTVPAGVVYMRGTVTVGSYSGSHMVSASAGSDSLSNVPTGSATLLLEALASDSSTVLYSGTSAVTVVANSTSNTTVNMQAASGGAPWPPTNVSATVGNAKVTVSWLQLSGVTYNLYWSTSVGVTKANGTKIAGVTTPYIHTGRTNGTAYYYVVTAQDANGESDESAQVGGTPQNTGPSAPTGVTATPGNQQVTISWTAVAGATGYYIYYRTSPGVTPSNGSPIFDTATPYTLSFLNNGTTYYFVVSAVGSGGEGVPSAEVNATPQDTPGTLAQRFGYKSSAGAGVSAHGYGLIVDGSGRIVVVGDSVESGIRKMTAWRYLSDGTPDDTFNGGVGTKNYVTHAGQGGPAVGYAVAIDSSGRVLVTGSSTASGTAMTLWRLSGTDGTPDTTFNITDPYVVHLGAGAGAEGHAIAIDSGGRILVAGCSNVCGDFGTTSLATVWGYTGSGGTFALNSPADSTQYSTISGPNGNGNAHGLTLDASENLVVSGTDIAGNKKAVVWRYKRTATAGWQTFSGNGNSSYITLDAGTTNDCHGGSVIIDSSGKYVVAGACIVGSKFDLILWRMSTTGVLDSGFGSSGRGSYFNAYYYGCFGLTVREDSNLKLVAGGACYDNSSYTTGRAQVIRTSSSGALDSTFNPVGLTYGWTDIGSTHEVRDIHFDSTGLILTAGDTSNDSTADMALLGIAP